MNKTLGLLLTTASLLPPAQALALDDPDGVDYSHVVQVFHIVWDRDPIVEDDTVCLVVAPNACLSKEPDLDLAEEVQISIFHREVPTTHVLTVTAVTRFCTADSRDTCWFLIQTAESEWIPAFPDVAAPDLSAWSTPLAGFTIWNVNSRYQYATLQGNNVHNMTFSDAIACYNGGDENAAVIYNGVVQGLLSHIRPSCDRGGRPTRVEWFNAAAVQAVAYANQ